LRELVEVVVGGRPVEKAYLEAEVCGLPVEVRAVKDRTARTRVRGFVPVRQMVANATGGQSAIEAPGIARSFRYLEFSQCNIWI
jgi:hypothetical protein